MPGSPDENAPNAIVSYYQTGSMVALAFDLTIRAQTDNRKSLGDVMRLLWRRYGRDFYQGKPRGILEEDVEALFAEATGADCTLAVVHDGGATQKAQGLSAGDVLVATSMACGASPARISMRCCRAICWARKSKCILSGAMNCVARN